jgi:hypothetical protein
MLNIGDSQRHSIDSSSPVTVIDTVRSLPAMDCLDLFRNSCLANAHPIRTFMSCGILHQAGARWQCACLDKGWGAGSLASFGLCRAISVLESEMTIPVALMVPCHIDMFYPRVGIATLELVNN